jgi:uridine phosphorylase
VYKITYGGREFGLYLSLVGAPASVCGLEEVIAMGARKFVFFGSCGILNEEAVGNRLIVPTGAVRDEGTSYHYLPPSAEIEADEETTSLLKDCLTRCGCPFVTGKMWTNDAIYRETLDLVRERRDAGCIGTDMEYSALLAATRFRGVGFAQFFYGADSLDNDVWQPRDLTDYGFGNADKYMTLALEAALRL